MRRKFFQLVICLLSVAGSFAQQWSGSSTTAGSIYRDGNIGVGISNPHKKITVANSEVGDGIWVQSNSVQHIAMLSNMGLGYWNGLTQSGDNMLLWRGSDINHADAGGLVIGPWTSANRGMRILPSGNIGIGTPSPHKRVTIATSELGDGVWVASNGSSQIAMLSNMGQGYWNGLTQSGDNMLLWAGSNINQADAGALVIGPWTSAGEGIRILPSGNVAIGTPFPGSFKLAVEGKIGAREVRVTAANPWPDYVFAKQYKLISLSSLEEYISKNNRLPNMPSAEEVKNNGIELGQINTRVVEKIEELTLYIIAMNKKIEKLEKDNAELRNQLQK